MRVGTGVEVLVGTAVGFGVGLDVAVDGALAIVGQVAVGVSGSSTGSTVHPIRANISNTSNQRSERITHH
jgi:hypothetical protein